MKRAGLAVAVTGLALVAALPRVQAPPPPPPPSVSLTLDAPLPDRGWRVKLTNTGSDAVRIVADPRLVSFDVKSAGHEQHCTLPTDMVPATDTVRTVAVPPGRSWSVSVDPLLYCFGAPQSNALVPGAEVTARYGWRDGRYAPPFAVTPLGTSDAGIGPAREVVAAAVTIAPVQVAPPLDGGASVDAAPPAHSDAYPVHLRVSSPERLDVSSAFEQTVTVTVTNDGDRPVRTLLAPETIGFLVQTPTGLVVRCGATSPLTAIAELTTSLDPHRRAAETVDLGSKCSAEMRLPGLYRVHPRLDTRLTTPPVGSSGFWNGEVLGPAMLVRIRAGSEPLPSPRLDPP